ncbi:MAG TPA: signal recognition particle receptor subunit alpha, partial [Phycisphaerae bacterium]|nr:signal recognition particle receptor subunit alpha [Phycisphaerae bacterium]
MGILDRLKKGLAKTRDKIASGFRAILPFGKKIDDAVLDQLEETMLADDMGPATVSRLIDEVRKAWKAGTIRETQEIIPFLKDHITGYWPEAQRRLHFAESGPTVILVAGINGSGKTTSVAKLAKYLIDQGKKVILG